MKPSLKHKALKLKETQRKEMNEARPFIWSSVQEIKRRCNRIQKLQAKEIQGPFADNDLLDVELMQHYNGLCEVMVKFATPYMHSQIMQHTLLDAMPLEEGKAN